jgi:hypothetical protein
VKSGTNMRDSNIKNRNDEDGEDRVVVIDPAADKLRIFGDESFDEKAHRVVAVAGLIGTQKEWDALVAKWIGRTGGKEFHATECETEFSRDPDKEKHRANLALYRDLTQLIVESGLRGFGIAQDLASAKEIFPGMDAEVGYYKCFTDYLNECGDTGLKERRQIEEFILHNRRGEQYNVGVIYQFYMHRPQWKKNNLFACQRLSFDTARNPRIQAADLVARESMKLVDNLYGPVRRPKRESLKALAMANNRIRFQVYTREYFLSLREKMVKLEKRSDLQWGKLERWLAENKLGNNWSNRFHFLIWLEGQKNRRPI